MRTRSVSSPVLVFTLVCLAVLAGPVITFRSLLKGNVLALYDLNRYGRGRFSNAPRVANRLVAHAGGSVHGLTYTNSLEALDENYRAGFRVFELDFNWTSDGHLVLVHDWAHTSLEFGLPPHTFSLDEFLTRPRPDGLHQMSVEDLKKWLHSHPDAFVVTDTKASNTRLLQYLGSSGSDVLPQMILQIYRLSELQMARELKPRAVWLTVYKSAYPAWALAKMPGVDAFVIPVGQYRRYSDSELMRKANFYVHSIPKDQVDQEFKALPGIYGMYVD